VLAGGKGSRLGRAKALEYVGKKRLIDRVLDSLYQVSQEIHIVTSQEQFNSIISAQLNVDTLIDLYPGKGALGGIYTGLVSAKTFYSLVVACDMPFLNHALLRHLAAIAPGFDIVIPVMNGLFEPLHAIYSKNCLVEIKKLIDKDNLVIVELLDAVKTRYVEADEIKKIDPDYMSFFNINTNDNLTKAKYLIDQMDNI
jgi:molybdopterin-guanine dinucleotide biosynthesis protein A